MKAPCQILTGCTVTSLRKVANSQNTMYCGVRFSLDVPFGFDNSVFEIAVPMDLASQYYVGQRFGISLDEDVKS